MSLFDKFTKGFSHVSDLFAKQTVDPNQDANQNAAAVSKSEKSNWFAGLFGKAGTNTPGFTNTQSLDQLSSNFAADNTSAEAEASAQRRIAERDSQPQNKAALEKQFVQNAAAANVNLSGDGDTPKGYIQVPVTLPHNYPTPEQEARAILTGLKYKDADIKAYNEHYSTDLVKDMSAGLGKNIKHNAGRRVYVPAEKKDVYVGYIAIDAKTHNRLKTFLDARRAGKELPPNNNTTANAKPPGIKLDPVTVTVATGAGAGIGAVLVETLPAQISTDIVPRAVETLGKVAPLAADVAVPAAMVLAEALPTVMIADHLADKEKARVDQVERKQAEQTYDAARDAAKATTLTMTMEDAEPLPLPIPESKPKERPFAEPNAKPQAKDLPNTPTDVVPTGNAKPQVKPEAEAQPQAKPETKVKNLPLPYTPDAPRNNQPQPQPPQLPKVPDWLPKVIAGATTAAIGVKASQMLSGDKTPALTSVRYDDVALTPEIRAKFEEIAAYRADKTMPPAADKTEAGTVAKMIVDGKEFVGHNTELGRAKIGEDNKAARLQIYKDLQDAGLLDKSVKHNNMAVNFLYHAELETIIKAKNELGSLKDKELTIYVDRRPCDSCYNHLPKVAELLGIKSITVVSLNPDQKKSQVVVVGNPQK